MKILIAGDFAPKDRLAKVINNSAYEDVLSEVTDIVQAHDYSIANLEAPIVNKETQIPIKINLSTTENAVRCLKESGFDCVTLANNHLRDYMDQGVENTICTLDAYNVDHVGGGLNLAQAEEVLIKEINGEKAAFINVCEHEFSIATPDRCGAAPLDVIKMYNQIQYARLHSNYIVIIIHGGHEHYQLPSPRMKSTYRGLIDMGADVIVNHHQHCYSGYEVYKGKPIFYGIGNFCFDWEGKRKSPWNEGFLVSIELGNVIKFTLYPYIQCDDYVSVSLMKEMRQAEFFQNLNRLNAIIENDTELERKFYEYAEKHESTFKTVMSPYSNRYLKSLCLRNLIPSFVSKHRKFFLYNYINCEAHRDLLLHYLAKEVD